MKKIIALTVALMLIACCLVGCAEGDKYQREHFYGVMRFSESSNRLVVYIPSIGDVEIPESDGCCSCFDGHEENEDYSYQLKSGDLVSINFRYERSWDDDGVAIMESYPARFDRKAHLIEALAENIGFSKTEAGYELSFPQSTEHEEIKIGDTLYFVQHGGYDGRAYKRLYASGEIISKADSRITVLLAIYENEAEFLNYYNQMTVELTWEE